MGHSSNTQTCQKYESSRPSLYKPQILQCGCVCVLSLKGRWDFFLLPNKNLILLLLSFYRFLYLAFNNILHFSPFICSFGFLIITSLSRSHRCYLWLCFAVPYLLICLFLQLFTYSFSTVCISVFSFIICLFIYLLGGIGKHNGKMHPNIPLFAHFSA